MQTAPPGSILKERDKGVSEKPSPRRLFSRRLASAGRPRGRLAEKGSEGF
ncbi:hypothetical protein HMPREF0262_03691 [Clostridium sp. ATCC 29733]|nr:hypothetical protein HMPREF0262_03691 [Clostridium sp. ATCC 29733]